MSTPYWLRRLGWLLRSPHASCMVRHCPRPRVGYTAWCNDHLDAIQASPVARFDWQCEAAERLRERGLEAHRWFLAAEVHVERERLHVRVIADILAAPRWRDQYDRRIWEWSCPADIRPPIAERIDELLTAR